MGRYRFSGNIGGGRGGLGRYRASGMQNMDTLGSTSLSSF